MLFLSFLMICSGLEACLPNLPQTRANENDVSQYIVHILTGFLTYPPAKRLTARQAIGCELFKHRPPALLPADHPMVNMLDQEEPVLVDKLLEGRTLAQWLSGVA